MLHRGRDTSAVCLGSRQRNIQLLLSLLNLLKCAACVGKYTTGHRLLETASNQRLFYLHYKVCTQPLPPEKETPGWEKDPPPLLQSHAQVATRAQGSAVPSNFLKFLKNSNPALQSSTSAKVSLTATGNLLPLGTELGSNVIMVWRTGQTKRLI